MRRPIVQRPEEQSGDGYDKTIQAGDQLMPHQVELGLEIRFEQLQILLRRNVLMDRVVKSPARCVRLPNC